jgi:predicted dehydrogenase
MIKTALVGLGRIASLLEDDALREKPCTHAGAITANPGCRLVAGADIDAERRRLFAGRWNVPVYEEAAAMLAEHKPDILHIATHPDSHYDYCRLAARYGVSVAVCEKPLADSLSKARKIAALQKNNSIRIITNHERRYSADYIEAAVILREKLLGKILSAKAVLYMGPFGPRMLPAGPLSDRRLIDVLWHDGTHLVDALMFLTGALPVHKKRWGAKLSSCSGTAWLAGFLDSETPYVMEIGAGRDHVAFEFEFSCERGRLRIGNAVFEVWESAPSPYAEKFRSLKKTRDGFDGPTGYFANMVSDAVACAADPGLQPRSSAVDGLRVIEFLHKLG